jgi:hypothetical protein
LRLGISGRREREVSVWVDLPEPLRIPRDIGMAAPTVEQLFGDAVEQIRVAARELYRTCVAVCGALVSASGLPPASCPRGYDCMVACWNAEAVGGAR